MLKLIKKDLEDINQNRLYRLTKEFSWHIFGKCGGILGMILFLKICTSKLSFEEYGIFSIYISLITITTQICSGPFGSAIARFYPIAVSKEELNEYSLAVSRIITRITSISLIIMLIIILLNSRIIEIKLFTSLSLLLTIIARGLYIFMASLIVATRNRKSIAVSEVAYYLIASILVFILPSNIGNSVEIFTYSVCIATFCSALFLIPEVQNRLGISTLIYDSNKYYNKISKQYFKDFLHYSLPLSIFGLGSLAQLTVGKLALASYVDEFNSGVYSFLIQVSFTPMIIIAGLTTSFFSPILNSKLTKLNSNKQIQITAKNTQYIALLYALISLLISFVLYFISKDIVYFLGPSTPYESYNKYIPVVAVSGTFFGVSQILTSFLMSTLNSKKLTIYITPIMLSLSFILMITLIKNYNLTGAIYSQFILAVTYCFLSVILFKQVKASLLRR